jgi:hypothetical protein
MRMKRSGRMNPFMIVGVICLIILIPLFLISKRGPESYAAEFLTALGAGDANKLAELSVIGNRTLDEKRKLWQQSVDDAKYYMFTWRITDVSDIADDRAAVKIQERRNLQIKMGEDEEPHQITMVKTSDGWKVLVDGMDRDIYPFLPRP